MMARVVRVVQYVLYTLLYTISAQSNVFHAATMHSAPVLYVLSVLKGTQRRVLMASSAHIVH